MKNKILLMFGMIFLVGVPLVSATQYFAALDLFNLFVENVFGNILFSIIGLSLVFFVIGVLSRMSQVSIIYLIGTFMGVMGIGYLGALIALPFFIFAFMYFAYSLLKFVSTYI